MTRFGRIRRRPDDWVSSHERARVRAAERLDGPLGLAEATWLEEHLVACPACAAVAAAYEADRRSLRAMGVAGGEPPRDLWARTSAAIERESAARGRGASPVQPGSRRIPLGALSGIAVIAVVLGASAISSGLFGSDVPIATPALAVASDSVRSQAPDASSLVGAIPTPFAVGAGNVRWVRTRSDGTFAFNSASVDEVCPSGGQDGCATIQESDDERLALLARPETIIGSPSDQHAIVVSRDAAGRQTVFIVQLPPADDGSIDPTAAPTATPAPTQPGPTVQPTAPDATAPAGTPTVEPTSTEPPATPTPEPLTPAPTPQSSGSPDQSANPSLDPSASPEPTVAASLAIASGIEVISQSAAFSADGTRFAFTARPADGSRGPDVYVWSIGEGDARPVTSDARSTFASWAGDQVLVSRLLEADTAGDPTTPVLATFTTVSIDLATGLETPAGDTWRPVVDPTGMRAVTWEGPIALDPASSASPPSSLDPAVTLDPLASLSSSPIINPIAGRLVLRAWPTFVAPAADPAADPWADPSASGSSATPFARPSVSPIASSRIDPGVQVITDQPVVDFDVRWEESGTWFAVWVSDGTDPTLGRLSLFRVDPITGLMDQPAGAPVDVPALPGFSIGQGRLAWVTPSGQGGEGSRVQVVAWAADDVGTTETAPAEGLIVVR